MKKLVGIDAFRAEERRRVRPNGKRSPAAGGATDGVFRVTTVEPKAYEDDSRKFRFCFSDGSVDRMGDTIDAQGWRINDFMANPVALWAHDSSAPPIGRASNVLVENERLMGDITFADAETYAFADTIYRLVKGKFLNAVSVGFLPVEYSWSDDDDREWGIDFKVQDLLEISVCPIPANPNALGEARAKGIDTRPLVEWAERALDGGGKIVIPKTELESLRKSAKEATRSPRRRDADGGMSETDPASGGAVVATCARSADDECGMSNPQECAVHMATEAEDKRIARLVARGVRAEIKRMGLTKGAPRIRRRDPEDGDGEGDTSDHSDAISKAMDHLDNAEACFKEADDHYDEGDDKHDEGMSYHAKAMEALDSVRESMEDNDPDADPDSDKAAARRLRRAKRLAAQHSNT